MPGPSPIPPAPPVGFPIGAPPVVAPQPPITLPPITAPPGTAPPPPLPPVGRGPAPVLPVESTHKTSNDACIKRLRQLNIDVPPKLYPIPTAPGDAGQAVQLQTNVFGVEIHGSIDVWHYMVHIKSHLSRSKEVIFTKKGKDDFVVLDRSEKCCEVLFHAVRKYTDFFIGDVQLVYDGQSTLYATADLFPGITDQARKTKTMEIDGSQLQNPDLRSLPVIFLEVYASRNTPVTLSSQEVARRTADSNISANNRAFEQILELACNQHCRKDPKNFAFFEHGKMFFLNPTDFGFDRSDCIVVGDGKKIYPGLKKRIQFVEGPHGRGQNNPALVIDSMKVAFHVEEPVYNKVAVIIQKHPTDIISENDRDKCNQVMRGLDLYTTHTGRVRHVQFESIHTTSAETSRFQLKNGESVTVLEYFQTKYNKTLVYPRASLIVCKERGQKNFYPMEMLVVSKNQRVKISQQTSHQSQLSTREGAVLPHQRQRLIMTGKNAMQLESETNPLLNALGVFVCPHPLLVPGRQLPGPSVEYQRHILKVESGKWRAPAGHYHRPAQWPAVWGLYVVGTSATNFTETDLNMFIKEFVRVCNSKGLNATMPTDFSLIGTDRILEQLAFAARSECKFVLVITDDSITHLHQKYKALEREHEMIIQDMMVSKAYSVIHKGKKLTLENVINKTNVKLGGTNYLVYDRKRELDYQLVIGIGVSTVPLGKFQMEGKVVVAPTVVGFAANVTSPQEFTGDFVLTSTGQDTFAPVEDIVKQAMDQYKACRNEVPKRVVIFRSGASEGAHGSIISYEIPLARIALKNYARDINLVYIVVSKDHVNRFFKENLMETPSGGYQARSSTSRTSGQLRSSDMNIPPGTCVDTVVTNPACKQFFLNSHTTLQGSAKTPLFTVLADDCNCQMNDLQELTYSLCHNHQIVSLTTSLPTPLYVAIEYAKRGRNMWNEALAEKAHIQEGTGSDRERLQELTDEICYRNKASLLYRRINA